MGAFGTFEVHGWEQKAAGYDPFFGQITRRAIAPMLDAATVGPGTRLLDVASGPGHAAAQAARRGAHVIGIDIAEAMVALARRHHPSLRFQRADAEVLPFADRSFDAVVGGFLLHHLERPERALGEFARVLTPGGRLALTAWDLPDRSRILGLFLDAIARARTPAPPSVPVGPDFFSFSRDEGFARFLSDGGFEGVNVTTLRFAHPIASAEELWDGVIAGTVRTAALITSQPTQARRRIRTEVERLLEPYRAGDRFELPVSVKLGTARTPTA